MTRSCVLFNAHGEDRQFVLPRRRFGAQWALELSTADPQAEAGQRGRTPARTERDRDLAFDRDPEAGHLSERGGRAAGDLSPPADRRFGFADAARWSRTCAISASRTCICRRRFQARPGSTHGYDVIDPRQTVGCARRRGASSRRSSQAARDAGMGIVLDVVPNHMAADDANRLLDGSRSCASGSSISTRSRACTDASSTSTSWPALRQDGPRGVRDHRTSSCCG